eukprot:CAMPEP_0194141808 /NCGR_PEP_ID=MMETSP0152-20130528/11182_1 /TAXON_ID=1049557 /ORGANISM="Thalassiothrix antarctica, Strain L6-D1" /LENGTH=337 /DNA_ID=CAMNT_0038840555 /DNA_START=267 /DNA_END=1280 /DNA_ORIENTATION=-
MVATSSIPEASATMISDENNKKKLSPLGSAFTKFGMMLFIGMMCLALPVTLFPTWLLYKIQLIGRIRKERWSLRTGEFCSKWLLRLIPFCSIKVKPFQDTESKPSVWVCNHVSSLDIFLLLASDLKARGPNKRPLKIVYWKQLEDNIITKLLFRSCGFIPVQMTANAAGEDNDYDRRSFKNLLKESKKAFVEGFDLGLLPEGQLNPTPHLGLLPCFGGAYTLAKMSKRPIRMMALEGTHRFWHAKNGMDNVTSNKVNMRVYPPCGDGKFKSADEFLTTFESVVGHFGMYGTDIGSTDENDDDNELLNSWLDGSQWQQLKKEKEAAAAAEEEKNDGQK